MPHEQGECGKDRCAIATVNIEVIAQTESALKGLQSLSTSFTDMHHANQDASTALGEFGISLTALDNPITLIAGTLKDSMDEAAKWGDEIQQLTFESGQSAQATSTLAVVMGDFGVSADKLTPIIRAMTKEGLTFNMDTLKSLIAEYQQLPDPVSQQPVAISGRAMTALLVDLVPWNFFNHSSVIEEENRRLREALAAAVQIINAELRRVIAAGVLTINALQRLYKAQTEILHAHFGAITPDELRELQAVREASFQTIRAADAVITADFERQLLKNFGPTPKLTQ